MGKKFSFFKSYYVDDTAFILLNRQDAIDAMKLIESHFKRFGLTVHTGSKSAKQESKTEALYVPSAKSIEIYTEAELQAMTEDIFISEQINLFHILTNLNTLAA